MPQFGVNGNADIDVNGPKLNIESPGVNGREINGKGGMTNKGGFKGSIGGSGIDIEGPALSGRHTHNGGFEGGNFDIGGKGDIDVNGPNLIEEARSPKREIHISPVTQSPRNKRWFLETIEGPALSVRNTNNGGFEGGIGGPGLDIEGPALSGRHTHNGGIKGGNFDIGGKGDIDVNGPNLIEEARSPKREIHISPVTQSPRNKRWFLATIEGPVQERIQIPNYHANGHHFAVNGEAHFDGGVDVQGSTILGNIGGPSANSSHNVKKKMKGFRYPSFNLSKVGLETKHRNKGYIASPTSDCDKSELNADDYGLLPGNLKTEADVPDANIDVEAPIVSVDVMPVEMAAPNVNGRFEGPDLDIEGQSLDIGGKKKGGFKMPSFDIKGPNYGGKGKINLPDGNLDINAPNVDIDGPDVNVRGGFEGPDLDIEGPGFDIGGQKMKGGFKVPSVDVKGPSFGGNGKVDLPDGNFINNAPNVDAGVPDVNVRGGIEGPDLDIEGPAIDIGGKKKKGGFKIGTKGKKFGGKANLPDANVDIDHPDADIDIDIDDILASNVEGGIDGPDFDIKGPALGIGGKKKKGGFKIGAKGKKFGGKGKANLPDANVDIAPNVDVPDVNIKGGLERPAIDIGGNVGLPDADIDIKTPNVDIDAPVVKIKGGLEEPGFTMPSFHFKWLPSFGGNSKVDLPNADIRGASVDINTPKADIGTPDVDVKEDIRGPNLNLNAEGPNIDVEHKEGFKMPSFDFSWPSFGGNSKVDLPNADIKGASVGINTPKADIGVPDVDVKGDIKDPDLNLNAEGPNIDVRHKEGFKMPSFDFSWPSFGGTSKVDLPNADVKGASFDIDTPKADIAVPDVDVKGEIKGQDLNLNAEGPALEIDGQNEGGFKWPSFDFKWPSFGGDSKVDLPSADVKGSGVKINSPKADIAVPDVDVKREIKGPDLNLNAEGPNLDIDGKTETGFKFPSFDFNWPSFGGTSKVDIPNADIKRGSVDIGVTDVDVKGEIKGPGLNISAEGHDFDIGGKHKGNLMMPDIGLSAEGPDIGGKKKGGFKKPSFGRKGNKAYVDISTPNDNFDVDADIEGSGLEGGFKMPSFGVKGPNFGGKGKCNLPAGNLDINAPNVDVGVPNVNVKGGIEGPDLDIEGPSLNIGGQKMKGGFKVPSVDAKGPNFGGNGKVDLPGGNFDINGPDVNVNGGIAGPDLDIEGQDFDIGGKKKKGGFKMPSFGVKGSSFRGKGKVNLPDEKLNINALNVDVGVPDVNVKGGIEGPDLDIEGPSLNIGGQKMKGGFKVPSVDVKGPNFRGNGKVDLPGGNFDINGPDVNVKGGIAGPDLDIEGQDFDIGGKKKKGGFKMPSFGVKGSSFRGKGKVNSPDGKLEINAPNVDVGVPDVNAEGGIGGPALNIEGQKMKGGFNVPSIDVKGPNFGGNGQVDLPGGNIDINNGPDVDVSDVNAKGRIERPDHDIKGPGFDIGGKKKKGGFKMPSFGVKGSSFRGKGKVTSPDGKRGSVAIGVPDVEVEREIKDPDLNIGAEGPDLDIHGKHKGGLMIPSSDINLSSFSEKGNAEIKGPCVDIDSPIVDIEAPSVDINGGIGSPDLALSAQGPAIDIGGKKKGGFKKPLFGRKGNKSNADISTPKANFDAKGNIEGSGLGVRSKQDLPDVDVELSGPSLGVRLDGRQRLPSTDL